jgi:ADP-ribose pyrophosphatase
MIPRWLTLATELLHQTPIFSLKRVRRRHPTDHREADFFQIDSPEWVNILAITADQQLVLVRQYRHGVDELTLEIPGGCVDPGELPLSAAKRELLEETGYTSERWEQIGYITANPAFMTNGCTTFIAHDAKQVAAQDFDEHEELELVLRPVDELHEMVHRGEIHHGIVVCAAYHLLARQVFKR